MNPYESSFVQRLDRTAEKNPLLWLPCVVMLAVIFGIYRLTEDVKAICTYSGEGYVTENSSPAALRRKPLCLRVISVTLVFLLTFTIVPDIELNAHAEEGSMWRIGYHLRNNSDFSIDTNEKYNGEYSIKIENTGYNDACVQKTYSVEPNTRYRFSAMVKYDGFSVDPDDDLSCSGASIGISGSDRHSDPAAENIWTKLEYSFDTNNQTEVTLCLRNGINGGGCRGTAWFSDVRLEKNITNTTNEWNVLAVIFKNVDTYVTKDGISYNFAQSLDNADVSYLTKVMNNLYTSIDSISDGRMKIKNIDVAVSDDVLTALSISEDYAYMIDPYAPNISKVLDQYLEGGCYNQIIVISPIREIAEGWEGLGGNKYKDINFCQVNYMSGDEYTGNKAYFPDSVFVHEMLHGMEADSKQISPDKTPSLHDNISFDFTDTGDEWRAWYTAYMRAELPGGKGLDPSVYQVYNDLQYVLVSNSMSVEKEIAGYAANHQHSFGTDWKFDGEHHWHECDCGEKEYGSVHIEGNGEITVQPTESSAGVMTYSCTVCGNVIRTEDIPALGVKHKHSFGSDWSFDDTLHWHECECGEREYEAAHIADEGEVIVQPSEISSGIITYSCTVCGNVTRTEMIPAIVTADQSSLPDMDDTNVSGETESSVDTDNSAVTEYSAEQYVLSAEENVPAISYANVRSFNAKSENVVTGQNENIRTVRNGKDYTADVGPENQGYYANIYTDEGEFITEVYIKHEKAVFTLEEDIGFYIMIDKYPHSENINNSNNAQNNIDVYNSDDANDDSDISDSDELSVDEEDISSGAGEYVSSVLMETAAVPVSDGVTVPAVKLPQIMSFSNKKRRYKILNRRKLDDMVFVF